MEPGEAEDVEDFDVVQHARSIQMLALQLLMGGGLTPEQRVTVLDINRYAKVLTLHLMKEGESCDG